LTAFLILVLSALFAAPLFIDWNDYRPVFETQATKLLGRQVKVGGEVHLVLLPAPELRFDDIKVADQQGRLDRPFLEARSVEAWLNIGALMSGGVEAKQISIVDPVLRLDVKADGTGNWSDVGRRGVAPPFAPKDVMLDRSTSVAAVSRSPRRVRRASPWKTSMAQQAPSPCQALTRSQPPMNSRGARRSFASRPASPMLPACSGSSRRCAIPSATPPISSMAV
jgi:hypothetical protein